LLGIGGWSRPHRLKKRMGISIARLADSLKLVKPGARGKALSMGGGKKESLLDTNESLASDLGKTETRSRSKISFSAWVAVADLMKSRSRPAQADTGPFNQGSQFKRTSAEAFQVRAWPKTEREELEKQLGTKAILKKRKEGVPTWRKNGRGLIS